MTDSVSLNPRFKEALQCPICCELFTSPVFICVNGHSLCSLCKEHTKTCPVCRGAYSAANRNSVVESMLEQLSIMCKYDGCGESISLGRRHEHYRICPFKNSRCIVCGTHEEDLVTHLIETHEYKEIVMEETGGSRSFSGPYESWIRDTEWPKGIWRFGEEATVVYAKSRLGIFHVYLYRLGKDPFRISLSIEGEDGALIFRGKVPHISEMQDKSTVPHFNCAISMILSHYVKAHEDDEEILRLWVRVQKLS